MKYPFEIAGLEGHELAIEIPGVFSDPRLLLDGQPLPKPGKGLGYTLTRNDGSPVVVQLQPVQMGSALDVVVEGDVISVMEPLAWYQWIWIGLPFLLVVGGGCIGGGLGGACSFINLRILRSQENVVLRYMLSGLVSGIALIGYLLIAGTLTLALGNWKLPAKSKSPGDAAKTDISTQGSSPGTTPAKPGDPVAEARKLMAEGAGYAEMAIGTLKDTQNADALELLLSILEIPTTTSDISPRAIQALSLWKTDHERIAEALITQFPALSYQGKTEACQVLSDWNMKQHAPELIRDILASRDYGIHDKLVPVLRNIVTPECTPILLAGLPSAPELPHFRGGAGQAANLLELMDVNPDPAAIPKLVEHLNNNASGTLWRASSISLGKIGVEEAVATIENRLREKASDDEGTLRMFRAGMHRTHHPRGRPFLAESLKSKDVWTRVDAVDGLAETARPDDRELVAAVLVDPHPQMRMRVFPALPRLLPDGRATVEAMYEGAIQSNRFRTALAIAEALGDKDRITKANESLQRLRQSMMQEPRLDQWLGKRKDDLKKDFSDGEIKYGSLEMITIGPGGSGSARTWFMTTQSGKLRFQTSVFGDGPTDDVSVLDGYAPAVYGVRLNDPADLTWEILGGTEQSQHMWGAFVSPIELAGDKRVNLYWALDKDDKVSSLGIRSMKK